MSKKVLLSILLFVGAMVISHSQGLAQGPTLTPSVSPCARAGNDRGIGDAGELPATFSESGCAIHLPMVTRNHDQSLPPPPVTVTIDADPAHGPGPLSPLWRPGIVWQGGGGSFTNVNPTLVDYWAGLGGFERIGLVRIVPELDSLARGLYSLDEFEPLVAQVRDHGGRLLVKIKTTPLAYTSTPHPPDACPPQDSGDWRYPYRYAKYGVAADKEAEYKTLISDFIRYFSQDGGAVTNPELFGDSEPHPTLGMPNVLYEVWNEPNYEGEWCDSEEAFWHLYQLIVEAADELRSPSPPASQVAGVLPFTIGGPGWRHQTLRNEQLPAAFGAPDCLAADDPHCGAIRRFYDFLQEQGYLENGHISWWSYSYLPAELNNGNTGEHLDNIRAILNDARYEGRYASTLVVLGEWAPPFANHPTDLLPDEAWRDEYGKLFGKNINDDNEVGASLVPARLWDMTQYNPPPDLQAFFTLGEWPQNDYLPLFKGSVGVFTAQTTGLIKAITNVFRMLNRLEAQELAVDYPANSRLNLVGTANQNAERVAVLGWYHVNIKPYETNNAVHYSDLLAGLEADGIRPLRVNLSFQNLAPGATYTQTLSVVDRTHSNAFTYRQDVAADLTSHCGANPNAWQRPCVYERMAEINSWTLESPGSTASVALESTTSTFTADAEGRAEITLTVEPYSVWLVELERAPAPPHRFGITRTENHFTCSQAQGIGASATWIVVPWKAIEPAQDQWTFELLDEIVQNTEACGVDLGLKLVTGQGHWGVGNATSPNRGSLPPANLDDYYDWVYTTVSRYQGKIRAYTIENEVNAPAYWAGTLADYQALWPVAYQAVKDADPQALVADFGMTSMSYGLAIAQDMVSAGDVNGAITWLNRYTARREMGAVKDEGELMELLNSPETQKDLTVMDWHFQMQPRPDIHQVHFYESWDLLAPVLDWIKARMHEQGHEWPIEVWEIGYAWHNETTYDLEAHGRDVPKLLLTALGEGARQVYYLPYYSTRAYQGKLETVRALVDVNWQPRPAYYSYRTTAQTVGDFATATRLAAGPKEWVYRFDDLIARWTQQGEVVYQTVAGTENTP